jgi:glycosyltransferase involved in cell wall biosynthesis
MKIVFITLAFAFTEGMTYQDNLLANQLIADGSKVTIISDCYKYYNGALVKTPEEDRTLPNGMRLVRLKYRSILSEFISNKIRSVKGLFDILKSENPDLIFHHGLQSFELLTVVKYKKKNPKVKVYLDCHGDFNNSANSFLSKYILHKLYYRTILKIALPHVEKVFFVGYECYKFAKILYGVPDKLMEFYPLGGVVFDETVRQEKRERIRKKLDLKSDDILIVHSGKMDVLKRTEEVLEAFLQVPDEKLKLILIGSINDDIKTKIEHLILSDKRISFLGWKNSNELMEYLCAGDLYLQPGSQSATMQNALCCGSAVAVYPYESHKYLLNDSAFYVESKDDIVKFLKEISNSSDILEEKRLKAKKIVYEVLDYRVLASRLYK